MLNEIKSKHIMNKMFSHIQNRLKMKIIKYNKSLLNRLYITIEDFISYKFLKEFNKDFNLSIKDIDIEELDLNKKNIELEKVVHYIRNRSNLRN